jgi:hypothetical protein
MSVEPTICLDFDGVLYTGRWEGPESLPDPPLPGTREALEWLSDDFRLVVHSCRCSTEQGRAAIWEWLRGHGLSDVVSDVVQEKPLARVYVDDRGFRFEGDWEGLLQWLDFSKNQVPWHQRRTST